MIFEVDDQSIWDEESRRVRSVESELFPEVCARFRSCIWVGVVMSCDLLERGHHGFVLMIFHLVSVYYSNRIYGVDIINV